MLPKINKKIPLNNKGLSIFELLISIGALCFFAALIQSMLIVGHTFTKSQQNLFDVIQMNRLIKETMCIHNNAFKNINLNHTLSYQKKNKTKTTATGGTTHLREYKKINDTNSATPLLGLTISEINKEGSFQNQVISNLIEKNTNNEKIIDFDTNDKAQHYKVYQDSHTIVKLNFDSGSFVSQGQFISGYIFASRCVENSSDSIYTKNSKSIATFNPNTLKKSALYILNTLDRRPYYFPGADTPEEKIQCCQSPNTSNQVIDKDDTHSLCEPASQNWTPRIYVLYIDHDDSNNSTYSFTGTVEHIQEFPELYEVNNIWGTGFILSTDSKNILNNTAFQLDVIALNNKCITSTTHINRCKNLAVGTQPSSQDLGGGISDGLNMEDFIKSDISSCSGYSSGLDTNSLINL